MFVWIDQMMVMMNRTISPKHMLTHSGTLLCILMTQSTLAGESGPLFSTLGLPSNLSMSGFLTAVGGGITEGQNQAQGSKLANPKYNCPCYVSDWYNGSVWQHGFSVSPDSHVGIQATYTFSPALSLTTQVVERSVKQSLDPVQWAYFDYTLNSRWNIHLGRQRIPLYYYSDDQDVSYSFPWISLPPEVYGYEVNNYNGASVRYHGAFDDIAINGDVYTGAERVKNDVFTTFFYNSSMTVKWNNILGAEAEASRSFWSVHANYMQTDVQWTDGIPNDTRIEHLQITGLSGNLDFDKWFVILDGGTLVRNILWNGGLTQPQKYVENSPSASLSVGMRLNSWTPLVTLAKFWDGFTYTTQPNMTDTQIPAPFHEVSFTLRYDINNNSSAKIQYDHLLDTSVLPNGTPGYFNGGNTGLLRASYEMIF